MSAFTSEEVEELARKTLGLDEEPDLPLPTFYVPLFKQHLREYPNDTNFIVELAEPEKGKKSTLGGNGFGVVTCMEDDCWTDIVLSADPLRLEGGKQDGFGSFSDFQDHCQTVQHIRGRSERCQKLGIPPRLPATETTGTGYIRPENLDPQPLSHSLTASHSNPSSLSQPLSQSRGSPSSSILPAEYYAGTQCDPSSKLFKEGASADYLSDAGPSRQLNTSSSSSARIDDNHRHRALPLFSSPPPDDMSSRRRKADIKPPVHPSSPILSGNQSDTKPLLKKTESLTLDKPTRHIPSSDIIVLSDDSEYDLPNKAQCDDEDDVLVLTDSEIPEELKKNTNKDNPIFLTDDSDEEEMVIKPRGKGKAVARNGSGRIPLAPIFQRNTTKSQTSIGSQEGQGGVEMVRDDSGDSVTQREKEFDALFSDLLDREQKKHDEAEVKLESKGKGKGKAKASEENRNTNDPPSTIPKLLSADERAKMLDEEAKKQKEKKQKAKAGPTDVKPVLPGTTEPQVVPGGFDERSVHQAYLSEVDFLRVAIGQTNVLRNARLQRLLTDRMFEINRLLKDSTRYSGPSPQLLAAFPQLTDLIQPPISKVDAERRERNKECYWKEEQYLQSPEVQALALGSHDLQLQINDRLSLLQFRLNQSTIEYVGPSPGLLDLLPKLRDFVPWPPLQPQHDLQPRPVQPRPNTEYYEMEEKYLLLPEVQFKATRNPAIATLVNSRIRILRMLRVHTSYPYTGPSQQLLAHFPELRDYIPPPVAPPTNAVAGPSNGVKAEHGYAYNPLAMPGAWNPGAPAGLPAYQVGPVGARMGAGDSDDDDPYYGRGYEIGRPTTNDGLAAFFNENLKDFVEDATVEESLQNLGLNALTDHLPGLLIQLMPHQVLGVDFMISKEKNQKFLGGINGDAMGLGKTVQSIALMAANRSQDPKVKTTLIVAPLALLTQWKNEIESKCTPGLMRVLIYHGTKRVKSPNHLKQYDVILTTYGTLTSEFGTEHKHKKKVRIDDPDASEEDERFAVTKKQGPIFKVNWYRVILDEAHTIRNKNTRATKACFSLKAYYRWCLTGTLIMNSLDDIYPHLHFLGISPSRSWEHFRDHISKPQRQRPKLATKRAQAIIRSCCIRRHKDSELNGKKLLELPPKVTEVVTLEFTDEERQIYTAIENRFQVRFNSFLRKGTVMKHYSIMLVMLMRLRQLTCHPWLLRRNPNSSGANPNDVIVTDEDLFSGIEAPKADNIAELARASTLMGQEFVDRVIKSFEERQARLDAAALAGDEEATREGDCSVCFDAFNDERITPCSHSFCAACVEDIFNAPTANTDLTDEDVQAGRRKCPMCRAVIDKSKVFRAAAFMPAEEDEDEENGSDMAEEASQLDETEDKKIASIDDEDDYVDENDKGKRRANDQAAARSKKRRSKGKGKEKDKALDDDVEDQLAMEDVLPSTKMKRLGQLIDRIHAQDPNQKIIVFTQFVEFIDLCGLFLTRRDIIHRKYVGSMNQDEREETIKDFNRPADEEGSPKVILMSLKCGGVGLNLCAANHVICLDLAWNAATEHQAVDRAHRIGQTKDVFVHRLVISNTVEQRIMALQESKQALSDGAMGEGAGGRLGRLSVGDLIRLFGVGGHDDD